MSEVAILKQKISDLDKEIAQLRKEKNEALNAFHEARNKFHKKPQDWRDHIPCGDKSCKICFDYD